MCPEHQCSEAWGRPVDTVQWYTYWEGSGVMNRAASHRRESLCCGEMILQQRRGGYRDIIVSVTADSLSITRRLAKCLQPTKHVEGGHSVMSVYSVVGVLCALIIETFLTCLPMMDHD